MRIATLAQLQRARRVTGEHAQRERRLAEIRNVVDRFTYCLGLLIAGQAPDFENCADPEVAERLRVGVRPFLDSGDAMRPDFGAFGELRVEGDLLNTSEAVQALIEFDDRCVRETCDGRIVPVHRRRLAMLMSIRFEPSRVVDCRVRSLVGNR